MPKLCENDRRIQLTCLFYFESIEQLTKVGCFISEINNKRYQRDVLKNKCK